MIPATATASGTDSGSGSGAGTTTEEEEDEEIFQKETEIAARLSKHFLVSLYMLGWLGSFLFYYYLGI